MKNECEPEFIRKMRLQVGLRKGREGESGGGEGEERNGREREREGEGREGKWRVGREGEVKTRREGEGDWREDLNREIGESEDKSYVIEDEIKCQICLGEMGGGGGIGCWTCLFFICMKCELRFRGLE